MNVLKWLFVVGVAACVYHWWQKHHAEGADGDTQAAQLEKGTGFVPFPRPMGARADAVLIYAPANCPSDMAQRASKLAQQLKELGIPSVQLQEASFDIDGSNPEAMAQIKSVMEGKGPPVIIRGRAKANPTVDDVVAEYRAPRRR